ncbi:Selenoprotein W [Lemmus lemmus]
MALAVRVVYWRFPFPLSEQHRVGEGWMEAVLRGIGKTRIHGVVYLQLKEKLEHEFPGCLDICGEGTPQVTGFFEVTVAGKLVHSKKRGDGYVDTESKFRKLVAAIKAALAQCQ